MKNTAVVLIALLTNGFGNLLFSQSSIESKTEKKNNPQGSPKL